MKEVERIRIKLKLNAPELGAILGITKNAIYNYASGRRKPNDAIAYKLLLFAKKQGVKTSLEKIKELE